MAHLNENVFITAIGSDIGGELARHYRKRGCHVIGTYRNRAHVEQWRGEEGIDLLACDVSKPKSVHALAARVAALRKPWDLFISAVGQLAPIGPFFKCDIDEWSSSVALNSLGQLRLLHEIYPSRNRRAISRVAFLVGGGINNAFTNYSAYCLGKIMLVKMCELLDDEYPDLHAIAVGTGWVNTKIHRQTLAAKGRAGGNYRRTYEFVSSGKPGTSYADIAECIDWCFRQDRNLTGGRNFSVVHDAWREPGGRLLSALAEDTGKFKLRRSGG